MLGKGALKAIFSEEKYYAGEYHNYPTLHVGIPKLIFLAPEDNQTRRHREFVQARWDAMVKKFPELVYMETYTDDIREAEAREKILRDRKSENNRLRVFTRHVRLTRRGVPTDWIEYPLPPSMVDFLDAPDKQAYMAKQRARIKPPVNAAA